MFMKYTSCSPPIADSTMFSLSMTRDRQNEGKKAAEREARQRQQEREAAKMAAKPKADTTAAKGKDAAKKY